MTKHKLKTVWFLRCSNDNPSTIVLSEALLDEVKNRNSIPEVVYLLCHDPWLFGRGDKQIYSVKTNKDYVFATREEAEFCLSLRFVDVQYKILPLSFKGEKIMMVNLLRETEVAIRMHGRSTNDVLWVGTPRIGHYQGAQGWHCTWEEFAQVAHKLDYDSGFGKEFIEKDLIVAGDNWWLSRENYDGSEWWRFNRTPNQGIVHKVPEVFHLAPEITQEDLSYES